MRSRRGPLARRSSPADPDQRLDVRRALDVLGGILLILVVSIRPWKRLAAILAGVVAFGVVVHAIVAATTTKGTDGLLSVGPDEFGDGGRLGWLIRHWQAFRWRRCNGAPRWIQHRAGRTDRPRFVPYADEGLEARCFDGPGVWLAGFVWETRLVLEISGPTRLLLLGAILIIIMTARPQGLLGRPRVEIV